MGRKDNKTPPHILNSFMLLGVTNPGDIKEHNIISQTPELLKHITEEVIKQFKGILSGFREAKTKYIVEVVIKKMQVLSEVTNS